MDDLLAPLLPLNATSPFVEDLLVDDVDTDTCRLLGPVALVVQGVMGAIVLAALVAKRMREKPRRKWKIWLGDVGKQVLGQAFVHASNVAISALIANHRSDNPCSLYALNILLDTTFGVLLLYFLLQYSTGLMQRFQPLYRTGFYGSPFSFTLWGEQATVYIACLAVMKLVVLVIFLVLPDLEDGMSWMLSWLTSDEAQVVVVMLLLPLVMNLFQFLMVDSIIKSKDPSTPMANIESDEEALRRGFLEDGDTLSDDDDNDDDRTPRRQQGLAAAEDDEGYGDDQETRKKVDDPELGLSGSESTPSLTTVVPFGPQQRQQPYTRALHAYPPTSGSISSTTSSLPPYSSLPPPTHAPASQPQPTNPPPEGDERDDDGWGDRWSASGSEVGAEAQAEEEEEEEEGPGTRPPPLASPTRASSSTLSTSSIPHLPLSEAEADADDWGFGEEGDSTSLPPSPPTPTPAPALGPPPPRFEPPPTASAPTATITRTLSPRPPSPPEEEETAEEEDEWGFSFSSAPAADSPVAPLHSSTLSSPPAPPSPPLPPLSAASTPPYVPPVRSPVSTAAAIDEEQERDLPEESFQEKEKLEQPQQEEDDDEWGFDGDSFSHPAREVEHALALNEKVPSQPASAEIGNGLELGGWS
ncbi:hypothetical protein JCM1841_006131 [Sporobolomyces salmonicolor]